MTAGIKLSRIEEAIADFQDGKMVIIVDDDKRENEGDIAIATEKVTPEAISFMMREARGLICVSISSELAAKLELPLQARNNNSMFHTPFAVSIDHKDCMDFNVTAKGRAHTMTQLMSEDSVPGDFVSPGAVMPLIANPNGVLGRQGQTEGSYDLARLSGLKPSGVICEILNPDGTMTRGAQLHEFANRNNLKVISVEQIVKYRIAQEVLVRKVAMSTLNTDHGDFETYVFENEVDKKEHLALVYGLEKCQQKGFSPLVRIHSECLTGDVFGSRRCDCGTQLGASMKKIVEEGAGVILYLRQEGRGIGLANKLMAYQLQDEGHDTVDANLRLGFEADNRDFLVAAKILLFFNLRSVRLLTNNPRKIETVEKTGIAVAERVPLVFSDEFSRGYLETKKNRLGHLL